MKLFHLFSNKLTHKAIDTLSHFEKERLKDCLMACDTLLEDGDTLTYIGLSDEELKMVIRNWPSNSNNEKTLMAVNNCLNLLINGWDLPWSELGINDSYQNIRSLYDRLLGIKQLPIYTKKDLIDYILQGNKPEYVLFWGSKGDGIGKHCLSQFYPIHFVIDSIIYRSAEQYYMAQKALFFNDKEILTKIMKSRSPLEIKKLGRKVANFNQGQWEAVRFEIVVKGNAAKFGQNRKLHEYLKSTKGSILVEASPYDSIWGIGLSENDTEVHDPCQWPGENLLGFALMKVRDEIL